MNWMQPEKYIICQALSILKPACVLAGLGENTGLRGARLLAQDRFPGL
ncbi:hypothetical protein [Dyadobacter sediminis]|nr:hypothetical protein [Dyadobacter sediminis]